MIQQILESFRPPAVWGGYAASLLGGGSSSITHGLDIATMDLLLGVGIKLLTITTLLLAMVIQIHTIRKKK